MRNIFLSLIIGSLFIASCQHDPTSPPDPPIECNTTFTPIVRPPCETVPPSQNPFDYTKILPDSIAYQPRFNPSNPDELFFSLLVHEQPGPQDIELWKINLCSGEKNFLVNDFYTIYDVNTDGWIIFGRNDVHLWAIKTDGDSLHQLTFEGINFNARWLPGQKELSFQRTGNSTDEHLVMNFATKRIDSLRIFKEFVIQLEWSKTQDSALVAFVKDDMIGMKLVDLNTLDEEILFQKGMVTPGGIPNWIRKIKWPINSDIFYWEQAYDIYEYNLLTKTSRLISDGCNRDGFGYATKPSKGNYLMAFWSKATVLIPDDTLLVNTSLVKIDLDDPSKLERLEMEW